ncbi:MAG: hypothetical protein LBG79_08225 [Spirochaetaceae bacterium]|nr:hypothetical protein [Spirochaetaceae bacterium]
MKLQVPFAKTLCSPALLLSAAPLLIISTSRLAFALIAACALIWTAGISICISRLPQRIFPQKTFFGILPLFLFSWTASLFFFVLEILNPVLAQETMLIVLITPAMFFAGGICNRTQNLSFKAALGKTLGETSVSGAFFVCFAVLRETLGYGALSIPCREGIKELFSFEGDAFPVQIISSASGAFLLLGYIFFIARFIRPRKAKEDAV